MRTGPLVFSCTIMLVLRFTVEALAERLMQAKERTKKFCKK